MKTAKKALEGFNSMNRMGMQMMKNMMSKMGQTAPVKDFDLKAFNLPDMQKMADGMKAMNQKAMDKLPGMDRLTDAQDAAQELAKSMLPAMREQTEQMMKGMEEMNRIALGTMQSVFDQNCKMMTQVFDTVQKMSEPTAKTEEPAAPEKDVEIVAPETVEEPVTPAKVRKPRAPKTAKKPASAEKKATSRTRKPRAAAPEAPKAETTEAPAEEPAEA